MAHGVIIEYAQDCCFYLHEVMNTHPQITCPHLIYATFWSRQFCTSLSQKNQQNELLFIFNSWRQSDTYMSVN